MANARNRRIRGFILDGVTVVLIKRIKHNESGAEEYHVVPGGGAIEGESDEEALRREIKEELGVIVKVNNHLYDLINTDEIQSFYFCSIVDGTVGTGQGPEFNKLRNKGEYTPVRVRLEDLNKIDLRPNAIRDALHQDYLQHRSLSNIPFRNLKQQ